MAPVIKLSSGHDMPQVGFGLWKVDNAVASDVVYNAIKAGYRLFDGACGKSSLSAPPSPSHPVIHTAKRKKSSCVADTMTSCARCPTWRGRRGRGVDGGKIPRPLAFSTSHLGGRMEGSNSAGSLSAVGARPWAVTQYTGRDGTGWDGIWIAVPISPMADTNINRLRQRGRVRPGCCPRHQGGPREA